MDKTPEMVERVARAIHAALGYDEWAEPECTQCTDAARAAIEAMREPTYEMMRAGMWVRHPEPTKDVWLAEIDAALGKAAMSTCQGSVPNRDRKVTCETCVFWESIDRKGWCHRHPPDAQGNLPPTHALYWCGEGESR